MNGAALRAALKDVGRLRLLGSGVRFCRHSSTGLSLSEKETRIVLLYIFS